MKQETVVFLKQVNEELMRENKVLRERLEAATYAAQNAFSYIRETED